MAAFMLVRSQISRLSTSLIQRPIQCAYINTNAPLLFQATNVLSAEPLKRKKRVDPGVLRMREDRKKRRIEKQIRRLEKSAKTLKPIEENEVPLKLKKELGLRRRETDSLSFEEMEYRDGLQRQWSIYKHQQHINEMEMVSSMVTAQSKALKALRDHSEELYQEAIQIDPLLLPMSLVGPVTTPPIKNYNPPDGEYLDVTKKWK